MSWLLVCLHLPLEMVASHLQGHLHNLSPPPPFYVCQMILRCRCVVWSKPQRIVSSVTCSTKPLPMRIQKQGHRDTARADPSPRSATMRVFFLRALENASDVYFFSRCKVHSSQARLFLWDYKHSREVVVRSFVDTNIMNVHMDLKLFKQMLRLFLTTSIYCKTCTPMYLMWNDTYYYYEAGQFFF